MLYQFLLVLINIAGILNQNFLSSSTYLILAPRIIRPGRPFDVTIQVNSLEEVTINVMLQRNDNTLLEKDAIIKPGPIAGTEKVEFLIPTAFADGSYKLAVTASSPSNQFLFQNETKLDFVAKHKSIFIQTDKAIYKPGQRIHFRIIITDPELKPLSGFISVYISDALGNRIKQWTNKTVEIGVFIGDILLSDQPILGEWSIHADMEGEAFKKTFTIDEYVLPKFEVIIETPPYASFTDKEVEVIVKSKYTFGKPVKGLLEISAEPIIQLSNKKPSQKSIDINGEARVKFSMADLNPSISYYQNRFDIILKASITEYLTGIKQNVSTKLSIFNNKIKIDIIRGSETFKPGLKYIAYIKVAYQDDTLVPVNSESFVNVSFGSTTEANNSEQVYNLPRNGLIEADYFPGELAEELVITAKFEGVTKQEHIKKSISPSNNFIQIVSHSHSLKSTFQAGSEGDFQINSTAPLPYFSYVLMSKGSILAFGVVPMRNKTTQRFRLQMTISLSPRARLLVYYIRHDNEVLSDAMDLLVDGAMQNEVSISLDSMNGKDVAEPSGKVKVRVKAAPKSYIGIMAVDQSVLLLKSGNDITEQMVYDELESYDPTKNNQNPFPEKFMPMVDDLNRTRKKRMIWWVGGVDAHEIFENSGVVVLSNANVFQDERFYHTVGIFQVNNFGPNGMGDKMNKHVSPTGINLKSDRIRFNFPETWFWIDAQMGANGVYENIITVPDTITSWIASAIAVDMKLGFGVSPINAKLRVFRPFFISLNLPYSVIRGENVFIQAIIFNYLKEDMEVEVTLDKSDEFDMMNASFSDNSMTRHVMIKAGNGEPVSFPIAPKILGNVEIKVQAKSPQAADIVSRKLLVKPEGVRQYFNHPIFLDLTSSGPVSKTIEIIKPVSGIVEGSDHIEVTAIGDIMGPTINNLDNLLRIPYGCGEQNMLNFVPNIVVTNYLNVTDQLTDIIKNKAISLMEIGYQRELTYRRKDHLFSAFGDADDAGSTWLTAFVVKSFHQAQQFISIDNQVIETGLFVLKQKQNPDGSFAEIGKVLHTAMQGGASRGLPLTAYILITLLENEISTGDHEVQLTVNYLEGQLESLTDAYSLAIITYALTLANSRYAQVALNKLEALAIQEGDMKYWSLRHGNNSNAFSHIHPTVGNLSNEVPDPFITSSIDVEMTSYALLSYIMRSDVSNGLPIVRWLASQRNSNGGFSSTQDTVIGLQALGEFMELAYVPDIEMQISISANEFNKKLIINRESALVLQIVELPKLLDRVQISATGRGMGLVQVSWMYNTEKPVESEVFRLETSVKNTADKLQLKACTSYFGQESTGMVVMEMILPSGFVAEKNTFQNLLASKIVKRLETRKDDTEVIAYFDEINSEKVCLEIPAQRSYSVSQLKEVPVTVYQYYNTGKRTTQFYKPEHDLTMCDVCEDNCDPKCQPHQSFKPFDKHTSGSSELLVVGFLTLILCTFLPKLF